MRLSDVLILKKMVHRTSTKHFFRTIKLSFGIREEQL